MSSTTTHAVPERATKKRKTDADRLREAIAKLDAAGADRYLRQSELLAYLGISRPTLWQWRRAGKFPEADARLGTLLLAWRRSTVDKWLHRSPEAA